MLILSFKVGIEHYGAEATQIIEVVPLISLKKIPLADSAIKGLFNYRGLPTPVIDLCQLFEKRDCASSLSTRIILIQSKAHNLRPIGLIAEKITEVTKCPEENINHSSSNDIHESFLGPICKHKNEMIQVIDLQKVVPESINAQLLAHLN